MAVFLVGMLTAYCVAATLSKPVPSERAAGREVEPQLLTLRLTSKVGGL